MGGNALKNCEIRRVSAEEYRILSVEVLHILQETFPLRRICIQKAYENKPDFGDLDILFEIRGEKDNVFTPESLRELFNSKEVVYNGKHGHPDTPPDLFEKVFSLEYKGLQVDIIPTLSEYFYSSYIYTSFNDLGNFMGRIAHKMGFKYGDKGLIYQFRTMEDHVSAEIKVSLDISKIFEFLGYDLYRFYKSFNNLEDIFEFVASSKYFHKDIYLLPNRNHKSRTRGLKRKNYNLFLKWLEEPTIKLINEYPWPSMEERGGRKDVEEFMMKAFTMFPQFRIDFIIERDRLEQEAEVKALFNGGIVKGITGLENIELGNFMKYLRDFGATTTYKSLPLLIKTLNSPDNIQHFIKYHFMIYEITNSAKEIKE